MLDEEMEEQRFVLFNMQIFFSTNKQELILLSNCPGTAHSLDTIKPLIQFNCWFTLSCHLK